MAADNSSIAAPTVEADAVLSSATTAAAWAERRESAAALLTEGAEPSSCDADCARAATTLALEIVGKLIQHLALFRCRLVARAQALFLRLKQSDTLVAKHLHRACHDTDFIAPFDAVDNLIKMTF